MANKNNIIEINGKRYDARSGALLSDGGAAGVRPAKPEAPAVKKPTMHDVVRPRAKSGGRHTPTPAHTLMRSAVKKPTAAPRQHSKAQTALRKPPLAAVKVSKSAHRVDHGRLQQASHVPKSHLIKHFAPLPPTTIETVPPPAPVHPAPPAAHRAAHHAKPAAKARTTADLLEHALQHATSHEQPPAAPRHSRRKRALGIGGAAALVAVLITVTISQNLPNLRLQMASARAGFDASLPGYQPSGYSLDQLDYSQGVVATSFRSNSDDRSYTLTEKRSEWDSQTLRAQFVAPLDNHYQSVTAGGRTIYLYGNHNASWVNAGIWYQVQADGALSDHQLIQLATSL
jgi:hypothetical protein